MAWWLTALKAGSRTMTIKGRSLRILCNRGIARFDCNRYEGVESRARKSGCSACASASKKVSCHFLDRESASSSPGQHHPVGTYRACNEYVMSDRAVGRRQCSSPSLRVCFRTEPWPSLPDASSVFCTTATISRISSSKLIRPSTAKRAGSAASSASKSPRSPSTNEAAAHDSHRGIANAPTKKRPSSIDENTSFWDEHARRAATVSPKRTLRPCLVGWTLRLKPPLISTQAR
mmetsp:Transcript_5227/g.12542  ORF Transcript_5227/g.12542 Transcript_5227/m.12542 type:complete len:233 (+) Transcript_5227:495-1193(+)